MKFISFIALPIIILLNVSISVAGDDVGYEEARALFDAGKIVAVEPLLLDAKRRHSGRLLEIELEYEDGQYLYEIEILDISGRVLEFYYDAETGDFIKKYWDD